MLYQAAFVSALSATGLALPAVRRQDAQTTSNDMMAPAQGGFPDIDFNQEKYACPAGDVQTQGGKRLTIDLRGPEELATQDDVFSKDGKIWVLCKENKYDQISVVLDDDLLKNQNGLRCAVADMEGKMIGAYRNTNVDFTFSDGRKVEDADKEPQEWKFLNRTGVTTSKVVCDVDFAKITDEQKAVESAVNVLLREQKGGDATTVGPFKGPFFDVPTTSENEGIANPEKLPADGKTYATLEVEVGRLTNPQALRCRAFSRENPDFVFLATRGKNLDISFSDNEGGEWLFTKKGGAAVKAVDCFQGFKANNLNPNPEQPAANPNAGARAAASNMPWELQMNQNGNNAQTSN